MTPLYALLSLCVVLVIVAEASLSGESFYVIRDMQSGFCQVSNKRPQGPGQTVLGDLTFRSLALATTRAQQICGPALR